jgi:hypothetical protein
MTKKRRGTFARAFRHCFACFALLCFVTRELLLVTGVVGVLERVFQTGAAELLDAVVTQAHSAGAVDLAKKRTE